MVPIVLVRGLLREAGHWHLMVDALKRLDNELLILTPNVPGNGCLYHETSPMQIELMLEPLLEQLPSHIERYHVVAISMGSMLASHWAHLYGDKVASLTLINPSFARYSPIHQRFNLRAIPKLLSAKLQGRRAFEKAILDITFPDHVTNPSILAYHLALNSKHPVKFCNAIRQLIAAAKFVGPSLPPRCPTQVITSKHDKLVRSQAGQAVANGWNVHHRSFYSDAHDLPADSPTELADYLYQWLKKLNI
ncbi:alpha/beta fold hydrolase [Vibrio sp. 10N]|uniref:alpha/beta fold hydrolase n=1 Tax=Vibrio sp. 10N TaxID=3058938 RepID=UPI0028133C77|nr:hypothetical protein VB10N_15680 [Vibrio sp. 10N]